MMFIEVLIWAKLMRIILKDMTLKESVLADEGMHVFEWLGGEHRPLEELITEMDEVKKRSE